MLLENKYTHNNNNKKKNISCVEIHPALNSFFYIQKFKNSYVTWRANINNEKKEEVIAMNIIHI